MTKNESKLLSLQGIAKASAFCLLLSAFSVNAAMAAPAPAGTVDEVMAVQQGKKVTGVVIDGTGEPVIGANVVVKGTTNGTITDFDGNYTIEGVPADGVLVISYIGYLSQEIPVGNQSAINVTLKEDTQTLDEVVVVGYGTMRKSDVTGSISTAKGEEMLKAQNFSALDNLRGKAAGVNIFSNSSQPGAYSNRVVIRGIATINSSSNPLYVVDGVVMENFDLVNPNDIESMEVLKDASAAAIYGARGANGVIMVTTKRGKKDGEGVAISYQGSVSVSSIARKMDLLNAQEWTDTFMKGLENENKWLGTNWSLNRTDWFTDRNYFDANGNPIYDTDWQDEATRTAVSHNHQLNIQQAGKNSSMGAFLNYTDQQGIMLNTYNKRLNAKMAYDADPTKWLSTSVNVLVNHTWGRYTPEDGGGQEARRTMIEMLPWLPVYEPGTNKYTTSTSPSLSGFNLEGMSNPVFILNDQRRMKYNTQIFGNAALTFHLAEGLDLKTQFGLDSHNITYRGYSSVGLNNISMPNGWAEYENWNTLYWQEETYLTYNKVLGDHRINAMAGLSWQERKYDYSRMYTENFTSDFFEDFNMDAGTKPDAPKTYWERWAMNSYFLRFAYTFKDRYSATITGRYDGSSKFPKESRYGFFPSVSAGWNIAQEKFMESTQNWLGSLKLRASYGMIGNQNVPAYSFIPTMAVNNKYNGWISNGNYVTAITSIPSLVSRNFTWEKVGTLDIGIDFSMFSNRFTGTFDWYQRNTNGMLAPGVQLPAVVGADAPYQNTADMRTRGWELSFNWRDQIGKVSYRVGFNLSDSKSKIVKYDSNSSYILSSQKTNALTGGTYTFWEFYKGKELGEIWGYETDGYYTVDDFVDTSSWKLKDGVPSIDGYNPRPGDVKFKNLMDDERGTNMISSGNNTLNNPGDRKVIGNETPRYLYGINLGLNYKGFDLSAFLQGTGKRDKWIANTLTFPLYSDFKFIPLYKGLGDYWQPVDAANGDYTAVNPNAEFPRIYGNYGNQGSNYRQSDKYLSDASYLRIKNVTLSYTFPKAWITKISLSQLRAFVSVENLATLSSLPKGIDPETLKWDYPAFRTVSFGLNLTL